VISLAVFDMAGTTVSDGGTVDAAFADALTELGMPADGPRRVAADRVVEQTMGQSKIEVFTRIFGPEQAPRANAAFESAYAAAVGRGEISALPGAADVLGQLRSAGVHTCLTTGFSAGTRDLVLGVLGWTELVDLSLCPADAGRGRPWPDMVWLAMLRLRPDSAADVLVVGDTPSDMRTGVAAGAGAVVGVLSGAGTHESLVEAGAHRVVNDVRAVPELVLRHR
jgi:phosphoglycolate phosphatase